MISKLKNKVSHLFHPIQGEIWCLHRVVETRSNYPSNRELEVTPVFLEELIIRRKSEGYQFVSIDTLIQSRSLLPKKYINVSFDDGFRDIILNAFPIFKKHHIPFTIYLTTSFPQGNADIWWIQMEKNHSADAFEELMKQIYNSPKPMAETMHKLTDTQPDPELCQALSLSWSEIKEMVDSGRCTVGSHSVSHPGLTRIGMEACRFELEASKQIILDKTGYDAIHFSYPHSMDNETIREAVSKARYRTAVLGYGGSIRRGDDPYRLNRRFIVQK